MSGEDDNARVMDSGQGIRKGKPQQLRKRKANSSDEEDNGGKSEQQTAAAPSKSVAPAKGLSASSAKTEKPKKAMSRGLSFATDEGGEEEEETTFQVKKKTETKSKVFFFFLCLLLFGQESDECWENKGSFHSLDVSRFHILAR
jgi:hypothetical protein